ncbi:MAG: hypothetical protein WC738_04200 [Candidatus Omnitrophota bacterium]|jgi:hypothetical protein
MVQDLFTKVRHDKKEQLFEFIKARRYVKTSDVIRWGLDNYHNRADRDARDLAGEGRIRRMNTEVKERIFGHLKEDVWETVEPKGQ